MRKFLIFSLVAACGMLARSAEAGVLFDADGNGNQATQITLNKIDWSPDAAIAVGAVPQAVGNTFLLATHGRLATVNDSIAATNATGIGTLYEYTFVSAFYERTTVATDAPPAGPSVGDTANFVFAGGPVNFFEIYRDTAMNANQLAGTGYNDGDLVLRGRITASTGAFSLSSTQIVDLDQYQTTDDFGNPIGVRDNYPNVDSVQGNGSTNLDVTAKIAIDFIDTSVFKVGISPYSIGLELIFSTKAALPFTQADPSAAFVLSQGASPTMIGASTGSTGPINGFLTGTAPQDLMLESDGSNVVNELFVPEPGSLAIFGFVAGMGGLSRIRRRKK